MEKKEIEIRVVDSWPIDDIVKLYKAGGWWKDSYDKEGVPSLIAGSFAFAVAIDQTTGKAVGMGRLLSDGVSDAYIQDVIVLKEYRNKEIGKHLIQTLIDYCVSKKLLWIGLIAEPGTDSFYEPLGFKVMEHYTPMLYFKEE
jgi:ribosomal protein S18 acetylase RimI-like enzyme